MGKVKAHVTVPGTLERAEALFYDLDRWPAFIDGFGSLARRDPPWPQEGSIIWDSRAGGRGRVLERVTWFEAGAGQDAAVEDVQLTGTQRVRFATVDDERAAVQLELEYVLKERRPGIVLVDLLFVRRAMRDSLRRTLLRLGHELEADLHELAARPAN